MTIDAVYKAYLGWLEGADPCAQSEIFQFPVAEEDVLEDQDQVVNHRFYMVPSLAGGRLRCFVFFEENVFHKDAQGDLYLVRSVYHLGQGPS